MVVYLHESLDKRIASVSPTYGGRHSRGRYLKELCSDCDPKADDRVRLFSPEPDSDPLASGIGSDVMKPIAAPMVGGMITSTIHVLILVPVFPFVFDEGTSPAEGHVAGRNRRSNALRGNRAHSLP